MEALLMSNLANRLEVNHTSTNLPREGRLQFGRGTRHYGNISNSPMSSTPQQNQCTIHTVNSASCRTAFTCHQCHHFWTTREGNLLVLSMSMYLPRPAQDACWYGALELSHQYATQTPLFWLVNWQIMLVTDSLNLQGRFPFLLLSKWRSA